MKRFTTAESSAEVEEVEGVVVRVGVEEVRCRPRRRGGRGGRCTGVGSGEGERRVGGRGFLRGLEVNVGAGGADIVMLVVVGRAGGRRGGEVGSR